MKKDKHITEVIFRKEKDSSILAVFPYDITDSRGRCTCYAHIGQHSGMDWNYLKDTIPAKEKDYKPLKRELQSLGYNLKVIQKRNYNRYLKAYYEIRNN